MSRRTYQVVGALTVSCTTTVEAESEEEAVRIANRRPVADLVSQALYPDEDEAWHFENDGIPMNLEAREIDGDEQ